MSKGGKTSKIHLSTDKFGKPIKINLSAGNINDSVVFEKQIEGLKLKDVVILTDRSYSTYEIIKHLKTTGAVICIPPTTNMEYVWEYDKVKYKARSKKLFQS